MTERFSEVEAEAFVASTCFKTGPPDSVGVELEWLLVDAADPTRPISRRRLDDARAAIGSLRHGCLTVEPGGQLEISSDPFDDPSTCLRAAREDLGAARSALAGHGLALLGSGLDPSRRPNRLLDLPRYVAMERFFDRDGTDGRTMMCSTASVQVCVDAGHETPTAGTPDFTTRWRLLHALRPVLIAAFANSPFAAGRPTGHRCGRQAVWSRLDTTRTWPAWQAGDADPREAWVRYVMSARVLCLPSEGPHWDAPHGLTFGEWLRGAGPRPATREDLSYHLTTLFPPVRARGHLELRMIDAQPGDEEWAAVLGLVWALTADPVAADEAMAAVEPLSEDADIHERAARAALTDAAIAEAATACFGAAADGLARSGAHELHAAVDAYAARFVQHGRCPADDALDHWRRTGSVHRQPLPEEERTCPSTAASM